MGLLDIWRGPSPEQVAREIDEEIAKGESDEHEVLMRPEVRWRIISQAHRVAEKMLDRVRIDPREFRGKRGHLIMGSEDSPETKEIEFGNIRHHMQEIAMREMEEERRDASLPDRNFYRMGRFKLQSEVIEAMMLDIGRYIFGKDVQIRVPSVIDDRMNSTDLYAIFRTPDGKIDQVLGLDFTSLPGSDKLDRKIRLILRGIIRGNLTTALYLKSRIPNTDEHDYNTVRGIPRAIIGVSSFSAVKFAKNWLQTGKSNPQDFVGPEKRLGYLYTILENYRGQLAISKAQDERKSKELGIPLEDSFATKQLQRAYDRIYKIIHTDFSGVRPDKDRTLEHVSTLVNSRQKMQSLYEGGVREQQRIDEEIAKKRLEDPTRNRTWRPKRGY